MRSRRQHGTVVQALTGSLTTAGTVEERPFLAAAATAALSPMRT